jgi:hypothetical protein
MDRLRKIFITPQSQIDSAQDFIFLIFSTLFSNSLSARVSFCSSSISWFFSILYCISFIFVISVASSLSYALLLAAACLGAASSPSFTTITFFSSFVHHNVPSFSLKSGDEQTGHERSVKVAPCSNRFAPRLTGEFSMFGGM